MIQLEYPEQEPLIARFKVEEGMPVLYSHMAIVESAGETELDELLAAGLQRFAVRRLGPAAVQVDHQRLPEVRKLFERLGQTPRITKE